MKKILLTTVLAIGFCLAITPESNAQVKQNAVKWNIFGTIIGQYQLAYERALSENISVQLSAGLVKRGWSAFDTQFLEIDEMGFILIPEGRYYFKEALKGFYGAAFFRYYSSNLVAEDIDETDLGDYTATYKRRAIGGGLLIGYQALLGDVFVLDVAVGPQYKSVSQSVEYEDPNLNNTAVIKLPDFSDGIGIRFALNIGFAFGGE